MAKIETIGTRTFAANPAANTHAFLTTVRGLYAEARIEHQGGEKDQQQGHMNLGLEDRKVSQPDVSDPEAGFRQDSGNRIGADQHPEEIAVDEL
jgi:hypothetical protein